MVKCRVRVLLTLATFAPAGPGALADNPKAPDPGSDVEFLEFLGSVDSGAPSAAAADDGSWIDYLAQADIGKVAKTTGPNDTARARPPAASKPPASGDKKDE